MAIPARHAVFERLTLPSEDPDELASMVRFQFEKSLPYPIEETAIGFQILSKTAIVPTRDEEVQGLEDPQPPSEPGVQTTLLACGVHHATLSSLCAPLLERQFPERLTLWAMHVAAQSLAGETACGLWCEENDLAFGIFESGRLGFLKILGANQESLLSELPRALMSAEMAGAPCEFREVLLDPTLSAWSEPLAALLRAPVRELLATPGIEPPPGEAVDLTPETWRAEQSRWERSLRLRRRIGVAAADYVVILLAVLGDLGFQSGRLNALRKEAATLQPQVDAVIDRQTRWKELAPAVEPRRFAVELLFQAWQNLPTPETRITRFDLAQNQFMLEGETPDAQQAVEFAEKLKKAPELSDFRFEAGQPVILPNEHAQFRIFGKL